MNFSQRRGLKPAAKLLQVDSVDAELRNSLWSCYFEVVLREFRGPEDYLHGVRPYIRGSNFETLFSSLWLSHFKRPTDTMPRDIDDVAKFVRETFFRYQWNEIYDFLEFNLRYVGPVYEMGLRDCWNTMLERENAGYRIVGTHVVEITNDQELEAVDAALSSPIVGARRHFETAITLLSDRKAPDYRNAIKESISAVEAVCRAVTGDMKTTLGGALSKLQTKVGMHAALKSALSSLYGYTSDEQGIRHAMLDEPNLTFSDAKFMLIACSAFVNYVVGKAAEANLQLDSAD